MKIYLWTFTFDLSGKLASSLHTYDSEISENVNLYKLLGPLHLYSELVKSLLIVAPTSQKKVFKASGETSVGTLHVLAKLIESKP